LPARPPLSMWLVPGKKKLGPPLQLLANCQLSNGAQMGEESNFLTKFRFPDYETKKITFVRLERQIERRTRRRQRPFELPCSEIHVKFHVRHIEKGEHGFFFKLWVLWLRRHLPVKRSCCETETPAGGPWVESDTKRKGSAGMGSVLAYNKEFVRGGRPPG